MRRGIPFLLVLLAVAAAVIPMSPRLVELYYSRGIYPVLQAGLTRVSNMAPVALFDLFAGVTAAVALAGAARLARRGGWRGLFVRGGTWLLSTVATLYLLFLITWGLNYRRQPLEERLDFDRGRITRDAAVRLAALAVQTLNEGHQAAHATTLRVDLLERSFQDAHAILGASRPVTVGRPKRSLLHLYFRQAAIDGMTVPIVMEVILNRDLTAAETPFILAHEWAHLAGYADESEANFLAWMTCVRSADPLARYSGWLESYRLLLGALPRHSRAPLPQLAAGPRDDLRAINERLTRASPVIREAAHGAYDTYLKANRVDEGIASYGLAVQLMLGTRFTDPWTPAVR